MIRVGIGGWTYGPWRGNFYPAGLTHSRELAFASGRLTAIEINSTFYRTHKPASFRTWADQTPDSFVFTVKGPGYVANRRLLAEAGPGIARFMDSGVTELGAKLGPILWQFAPTKAFDETDVTAFLELLPRQADGLEIRHALEVRSASFLDRRFIALARRFHVPIVYADSEAYPAIADRTGDFVYARLQRGSESEAAGYPPAALDRWAERARVWAQGGAPADLPYLDGGSDAAANAAAQARPVFIFFIHEAKLRAPAAAEALIKRLAVGSSRTE